jgi:acetyl esterase/lipase
LARLDVLPELPESRHVNRRNAIILITAGVIAAGISACSALTTFDLLVPKDPGVRRVVADAQFGPGRRQRLDVYRPSVKAGPLPVIIFFYGGSWNSGDKSGYSWVAKALASRGFAVVIPDYRYASEAPYPAFLEDSAAAVRWAVAHAAEFGGDPKRLVLAGHSAGAYNAAMLAYDERWLGADRARVRGFMGLAGPYDFLPFDSDVARKVFGSARDLPKTQPVNFIDRADPPAFIASAGEDKTVREHNSDSLTAKLKSAGIRVERRRYPNVGHVGIVTAIARPLRGRASVLDDMTRFAHEVTR